MHNIDIEVKGMLRRYVHRAGGLGYHKKGAVQQS